MGKLRFKFALVLVSLIAVVSLLLTLVLQLGFRDYAKDVADSSQVRMSQALYEMQSRRMETLAMFLSENLVNPLYELDMRSMYELLSTTLSMQDVQNARVLDTDCRVVHDGTNTIASYGEAYTGYECRSVIDAKIGYWLQETEDDLTIIYPILIGEKMQGAVVIGLSLEQANQKVVRLNKELLALYQQDLHNNTSIVIATTLLLIVVGLICGFVISNRLTRPLSLLTQKTRQIALTSHTSQDLPAFSNEIEELLYAFENMEHRLKTNTVSRRYLENIISSMPDGLVVLDHSGNIQVSNPALSSLLGSDKSNLKTKHFLSLFTQATRIGVSDMLLGTRDITQKHRYEAELRNTDVQYMPVNLTCSALITDQEQQSGAICIIQDIRQRKKRDAEQNRLHRELQQSAKMQAIGQLTGGIAHDFNNLLGIMIGYTEMIAITKNPSHLKKSTDSILYAAERAKKLISQMLTFSRGDDAQLAPTDLRDTVPEHLEMIQAAIPSSIEIKLNISDRLPLVMINDTQLSQLLMNLLINARDAIGGSGRITVSLKHLRDLQEECSVCHKTLTGGWVELYVEDDGPGIPPEHTSKLFDPFFTSKDVGQGTGLGLSVVYGIMMKVQGHVIVESRPGSGAKFRLMFPPRGKEEYQPLS